MYARADNGIEVTIADFYEAGREALKLSILAGAGSMATVISEPAVNRPGLALTGFMEHFAWDRIQLIGLSEDAYMKSLDPATRTARFVSMVEAGAYCFIFAYGQMPSEANIKLAEERGVVLMSSPLPTRRLSAQAVFTLERLTAPRISLYGTMIEVEGLGVMIEGDPGLGKSETALGLIRRGCALVSDDLTCIRKDVGNNCLFASASAATAGYMEIRGIGIVNVRRIFGASALREEKRLEMVVTLKRLRDIVDKVERVGQGRRTKEILGVEVPNIVIPVSAGRDLVNLVETAVKAHKLATSGYDPVSELSEHLRIRAERTSNG